jgi:hypothetical protein
MYISLNILEILKYIENFRNFEIFWNIWNFEIFEVLKFFVQWKKSSKVCSELYRYRLRGRIQLATIKFLEHILNANNSLVNKVYSSNDCWLSFEYISSFKDGKVKNEKQAEQDPWALPDLENTEVPWEGSFYCVLTFHIWRLVTSQVPHSVNLGWFRYSLTTKN